MYQIRPERGEKRACLSCEAKFYDLGRAPVLCPKCGAEFVEVVRPVPAPYQRRGRSPFGLVRARPIEAEEEIDAAALEESDAEDEEKGLDEVDDEPDAEAEEPAEE